MSDRAEGDARLIPISDGSLSTERSDLVRRGLEMLATPRKTLTVSHVLPADFSTIAAAIEHATDGTRIEVGAGDYEEYLLIDKRLEISGYGHRETTIRLKPGTNGWCIVAAAEAVSLKNLYLTFDGRSTGVGALVVAGPGTATLDDCEIDTPGIGAIQVDEGQPRRS